MSSIKEKCFPLHPFEHLINRYARVGLSYKDTSIIKSNCLLTDQQANRTNFLNIKPEAITRKHNPITVQYELQHSFPFLFPVLLISTGIGL